MLKYIFFYMNENFQEKMKLIKQIIKVQYSSFKIHKNRNARALHLGTPKQN